MPIAAVAPEARRYVIQGRTVTMPVVVRDAASAAATWVVSSAAARRLLPGPELDVVEVFPGRTLFSIGCIDYRDNDLGNYGEVSVALFVRERRASAGVPYLRPMLEFARNRLAVFIYALPVNQSFTCEAGQRIWGFPKTVEEISFCDDGARRECRLVMGGMHVLTMSVPRGGARTLPDSPMQTYTYLDGRLHRTAFTSGASGVGVHIGGTTLALGDHPMADTLRSLGLPKWALLTVWMEHQHGRFEAPVPAA
jgi:hypothetical protein